MKRWEIYIYALLIACLNLPLAFGTYSESMIFLQKQVLQGQLWRIFTHPFVHASWYHLALDALAFFVLYMQLAEPSRIKRGLYIAGCGLASLLATLVVLPTLASKGYCGLSGIAHGLMAICALDMINDASASKTPKLAGTLCFVLLICKCLIEVWSGQMVFSFFHKDLIGCPIALGHVGGVLGGAIMYIVINGFNCSTSESYIKPSRLNEN